MPSLSWLPRLLTISPWGANTFDLLYELFHSDFIASRTYYQKSPVGFSRDKEDGKEKIFWHITTREDKESAQRLADFRRCERLPWLKAILENAHDSAILNWEDIGDDGTTRVYVWLKDYDYIAIMKRTKKGFLILLTAYWLEYENAKRKLMKKYNAATCR